jgi:hypothetical protein
MVGAYARKGLDVRRLRLLLWPTFLESKETESAALANLKLYVTCKSYGGCICKKGAGCKETASAALANLS